MKKVNISWICFIASNCLTSTFYLSMARLESYFAILISMSFIDVMTGLGVIWISEQRKRAVWTAGIGLVLGQWWLLLWLGTFSIWHFQGFAP